MFSFHVEVRQGKSKGTSHEFSSQDGPHSHSGMWVEHGASIGYLGSTDNPDSATTSPTDTTNAARCPARQSTHAAGHSPQTAGYSSNRTARESPANHSAWKSATPGFAAISTDSTRTA